MYKNRPAQASRQTGKISLLHVLLMVIVVVSLAVQWKRDGFPFPQIKKLLGRVSTSSLTRQTPATQNRVVEPSNTQIRYTDDTYYNRPSYSTPENTLAQQTSRTSSWDSWFGGNRANNDNTTVTVQELPAEELIIPNVPSETRPASKYRPPRVKTTSDYLQDQPYEVAYPINLQRGYYTVQVFSGYNSKAAYELRSALRRDGYRAIIREESNSKGILFKVRIGHYLNRSDAFAVRSQIQRRYPSNMAESFVIMVN